MPEPVPAAAGADTQPALRRALVALGVTEITSYGVLYYSFPVVLGELTTDTGWSATTATGAFTVGLLVSALAGVPVGRWLDRHGPRRVMTLGSAVAAAALVGVATAPTPLVFTLAWALAGCAMAATFYPPAFTALTRWYGERRLRALTVLTLFAGLASTVFAPLTAALLTRLDWRSTYLVLAAVLAVITIPLHAAFLGPAWPEQPRDCVRRSAAVRAVLRSRSFQLLTSAMTLGAFGIFAATITLVPLLTSRGFSVSFAAFALAVGGVAQLLGRVGFAAIAARIGSRALTVGILLLGAGSVGLLGALPGPAGGLLAAAILLGLARGAFTLVQATTVGDRWGTRDYGSVAGVFLAPQTVAMAVAPWAATVLATGLGSYATAFLAIAALMAAGAVVVPGTTAPDRVGGRSSGP